MKNPIFKVTSFSNRWYDYTIEIDGVVTRGAARKGEAVEIKINKENNEAINQRQNQEN